MEENRMQKKQPFIYYREVALPITKLVDIGNSLGIIIPKSMRDKHHLSKGEKVRPILHLRYLMQEEEIPVDLQKEIAKELSEAKK